MRSTKYGLGLAIAAACMTLGASTASAAATKVLPADVDPAQTAPTKDWTFADTRNNFNGFAFFQTGPKVPALSSGSLAMNTAADNNGKAQLFTKKLDGTKLSDIDGVGYSTYRKPTSTGFIAGLPAINIRLDLDGAGAGTTTRNIVYEPYGDQGNGAVETGVWQDWDAFLSRDATYWASGADTGGPLDGCDDVADRNARCNIQEILALVPDATIVNYGFGVNLGSFQPNLQTNVDALYMSVNGVQSTFDFEEARDPGDQGPQGNPGTNGTNGTNGAAGANGQTGATGQTGAQGPQGPQGSAGFTPSSTTTTGRVSLVSKSLKAAKSRKVSVSITCPRANGLCEGRLSLLVKGKTIARSAFEVKGGRSGKVTVTLSKKAYKALKKSQSAKVNVFSRDNAGNASSASKSLTLKK